MILAGLIIPIIYNCILLGHSKQPSDKLQLTSRWATSIQWSSLHRIHEQHTVCSLLRGSLGNDVICASKDHFSPHGI